MGWLLGNRFETEEAQLSFFPRVMSKILLDRISQGRPGLREVTKWLMGEVPGYRGGVRHPSQREVPDLHRKGEGES